MRKNNKGFSLVELIIVIAIMAILAASIAPALIRYIQKSRDAKYVKTAEACELAATTVYIKAAQWGYDIECLVMNPVSSGSSDILVFQGNGSTSLQGIDSGNFNYLVSLFWETFGDAASSVTSSGGDAITLSYDVRGNLCTTSPFSNKDTDVHVSRTHNGGNVISVKYNNTDGVWFIDRN